MTLRELLHLMREHLGLIVALPVALAVITAIATLFLPNQYTASTTMYVLAQQSSDEGASTTQSELSAAQLITNDVVTLIKSDRVKSEAAGDVGIDEAQSGSYSADITSSTTTRIITLEVTGPNPQVAADLANAMVNVTSDISRSVMNLQSVNPIDEATAPSSPSGPNRPLYVGVALLGGLFVAIVIVVLMDMLDTRVRSGEEIEQLLGDVPVIGHIPAVGR